MHIRTYIDVFEIHSVASHLQFSKSKPSKMCNISCKYKYTFDKLVNINGKSSIRKMKIVYLVEHTHTHIRIYSYSKPKATSFTCG